MTTLQISKEKAKELYPTASIEFKTMLEETFGKDFFKASIMDRVKSFEDALAIKYNGEYVFGLSAYFIIDEEAFRKLKIITEVLNEGKEGKWYPFFDKPFRFHDSAQHDDKYFYQPRKLLPGNKRAIGLCRYTVYRII